MKVLYISHACEPTGWGRAAIDNILALDAAGIDVVCRNVELTGKSETPEELIEFQRKHSYDATHCIQHVLPHHLVGTDVYKKNIAYFVSETDKVSHLDWHSHLQLVDEVWTPNAYSANALYDQGLKAKVVHHCCDVSKYSKTYNSISIPEVDYTFKFYCISDFNDRKNIESVVRCFHATFDPSEPVSLILKLNKHGQPLEKVRQEIQSLCNNVKIRSRLYDGSRHYHKEVVITGHSTEDEIMSLHQYGDCFLNFTHGEAWSIPTFDAMCFGNTPIVSNVSGPRAYITEEDFGQLIDGQYAICNSVDAAFPDLFTAREYWFDIDEKQACEAMRYYYENRKNRKSKCIKRSKDFSHKEVGKTMEILLNE